MKKADSETQRKENFYNQYLGMRIKELRESQGRTIEEIANEAEVSTGLISLIERGKVNPSINVLWAISRALKVPIGSFFGSEHSKDPVVRSNERKLIKTEKGIEFYLLCPDLIRKLEVIYKVFNPGASTGTKSYTHKGEEFGTVLSGKIEVTLGNRKYVLKKGDSIYFSSTTPHRVENSGKRKAVTIWVITPPSF